MSESTASRNADPVNKLNRDGAAPLESILCTDELHRRPSRAPDYEKENRALVVLARALAESPRTILQVLADTILSVCESGSAGISLLTLDDGGKNFYWPAIAGEWKPHIGGGTPRDFGPCGDVLDQNTTLMFRHVEKRYTYFQPVTPPVEECLLVPFYAHGKAVGTIWAVAHDDRHKFDEEDERLMHSLGTFASSAYQVLASLDSLKIQMAEREEAQAAARQRTAQFETLLNEAPHGVYVVDEDFRLRQVNPAALRAFGEIPNLIGRDFSEVIHILWPKPSADEIVERFRHTLETGERYVVRERIEERLDRGVRGFYEWQISRIPLPDGSHGVVCYFWDISAHVQARAAIAESAERLRFMAESMPQKIFTATPSGDIDYFNRQWMDFTGLAFEQIRDWGWTQFIHADDVEENIRRWKHSIETGEHFQLEHRFRRHDGVYRWHLSRAQPMRDSSGSVLFWIGSNTDIDDQKRTEEALRESEDRLRALNGTLEEQVQIRTQELEQRNAEVVNQSLRLRELSFRLMQIQDAERRHIARELHDSAGQTLTALAINVSGLIQYARQSAPQFLAGLEDGQRMVRELNQDIRTTAYLLHPPLLEESGLRDALPWYVRGLKDRSGLEVTLVISEDFGRLSHEIELTIFRIVQECLTNVHRHSGSKVAEIRVARSAQAVLLEVQDHGGGITPEKLLDIQSRGSGVGIRGMRERVTQLGGEMKIESAGGGTKISVMLPLMKTANSTAAQ